MPLRAALGCILAVVALGVGGWLLFGATGEDETPAQSTAQPAGATSCPDEPEPYGEAPDGFVYAPADEAARLKAVQSLQLDESGGPVDMRLVTRQGLTLGSLIGIPSANAAAYADGIIERAEAGRAEVTVGRGYKIIPLESGSGVAVGVRGCRAVLITAQDPSAVRYLAEVIFTS